MRHVGSNGLVLSARRRIGIAAFRRCSGFPAILLINAAVAAQMNVVTSLVPYYAV
jgi:hypothetical protein